MANYRKMYVVLCSAVDQAISDLQQYPFAYRSVQLLHQAMQQAEDIYIDSSTEPEKNHPRNLICLDPFSSDEDHSST